MFLVDCTPNTQPLAAMKTFLYVIITLACAPAVAGNGTCPAQMRAAVEARVAPVLEAFAKATDKGNLFDEDFQRALVKLLGSKDKASKEARVALMDYDMGDASAETLACAVTVDGSVRLLKLYSRCDIRPGHSTVPRDRTLALRAQALEAIREKRVPRSCVFE